VTRAIAFTAASIARAIKGVEQAGLFVIGVKADGTLIVGNKRIETASLVPVVEELSLPVRKSWGERLGGRGEA
jgi:hypothetical protein